MQLNPHDIFKEISIFYFIFFFGHCPFIYCAYGNPSPLTDRKGTAIYSRLRPEQPSQYKCTDLIFFWKKIYSSGFMQRVKKKNKNYSYYLKDEIHLVICKYSTGRSYNGYLMEL